MEAQDAPLVVSLGVMVGNSPHGLLSRSAGAERSQPVVHQVMVATHALGAPCPWPHVGRVQLHCCPVGHRCGPRAADGPAGDVPVERARDTVAVQFDLDEVIPEVLAMISWFICVLEGPAVVVRSACRAGGSGVGSG